MSDQQVIKHNSIHEAIAAVMSEVGYVRKQRASGLNYSFAGETALIEALRPAMVAHGIYCYAFACDSVERDEYTTAKGSQMFRTTLRMTVRYQNANGDPNDYIDTQAYGEGADTGDKSLSKAMTGAYKYSLRETFCLETGDDPDKYPSEPVKHTISHSITTPKPETKPINDTVQLHEKAEIGMPLDLAEAETNSKGELYVNIDTETLTRMVNTMAKLLKKPETTAEQAEDYNRKIAAAKAIIASR